MATVTCYRCDSDYRDGRVRCECGEPLWYDLGAAWADRRDAPGMARYVDGLPIERLDGIAAGAGGTPLVRAAGLDAVAGCNVYVKDECENPTGSYKDRGSAVAVSKAIERGTETVGTVSYGNMAMSTAAHAASLGRDCVVLVPDEIQAVRLELIAQYGPTIVQVEGDYGKLYPDALTLNETLPVEFLLGDVPSRISGYKTALYEIYESITPDAIVLPTSSGGFASGIWRGVRDLEAAGVLSTPPRLYLVQTAASDPITRAYRAGHEDVAAMDPAEIEETIAHSIGNPDPPSGARALAAARATGGEILSVTDEEIERAKRQFARAGGFCVEPASATPLAGVEKLSERGLVERDEQVVLIPTGTGFKEMGVEPTAVETERVVRGDLAERLEAVLAAS